MERCPYVNITSKAHEVARHGPQGVIETPHFLTHPEDYEEGDAKALEALNEAKEAMSLLTADVIKRFVDKAIAQKSLRPPYGLVSVDGYPFRPRSEEATIVTSLDCAEPFGLVRAAMYTTVKIALCDTLEELAALKAQGQTDLPIVQNSELLRKMQKFSSEYISPCSYTQYFANGISSGEDAMRLLEQIPVVLSRDLPDLPMDPDQLTAIAENSWPTVAELAMGHMDAVSPLLVAMAQDPSHPMELGSLKPDSFKMVTASNGRMRMVLRDDLRQRLIVRPTNSTAPLEVMKYKTGCPAMVNFSEDGTNQAVETHGKTMSAIKKLYDWHVALAREIYINQYGSATV